MVIEIKRPIVFFIIVMGVIFAGCTIQVGQPIAPETPVQITISPTPTTQSLPSINTTPVLTLSSAQTNPVIFERDKINKNFRNIAFGMASTHLTKWDVPVVKIGIAGDYRKADYKTMENFIEQFNQISSSTHGTLYRDDNQPITILLVPESLLKQIVFDQDAQHPIDAIMQNPSTGDILLLHRTINDEMFYKERIYINSESGEYREFAILRGTLMALGFPGYSEETDSIFYPAATNNLTELSSHDWVAVSMMYNMGFERNETISQANSKLLS